MKCADCFGRGKDVTLVYDARQAGEVCQECGRVFSLLNPNPRHKHFVSRKAMERAMREDRRKQGIWTASLCKRIIQGT